MQVEQMLLDMDIPALRRDTVRNAHIAQALMEDSSGEAKLMESICEQQNMLRALKRVESNDGAPGVDGMTCRRLRGFVRRTWSSSKQAIHDGSYRPLPVRRKDIPKPDGGTRQLGIPAVMDRLVQQAMVQILVAIYDHTFSDSSFGYRPGRSQAQAVEQFRQYVEDGYTHVISLDLSKFFDRVNHHRLMSRMEKRIKDRRGHRFVRYADDIVILVRSQKAGERVLNSITQYITHKLKLKVNAEKSQVARPWEVKFLGYKVTRMYGATRSVTHPKTVARFKERIREITRRIRRANLHVVIAELNQYIRGWVPCYGGGLSQHLKRALNRWIIRRLKAYLLKQWRKPKTKIHRLKRLGLAHEESCKLGNSRRKTWRISGHYQLHFAMPQKLFTQHYGLMVLC